MVDEGIAVLAGMAGNWRVDHVDAAETMPAGGGVSAAVAKAIRELGMSGWRCGRGRRSGCWGLVRRMVPPALLEAAKSPDAEVSIRAERLLRDIKAGITPDMPEDARRCCGLM